MQKSSQYRLSHTPFILRSLILFMSCLLLTLPAYAIAIKKIVVFGDSLSDNGNIYQATQFAGWGGTKICKYVGFSCQTKVPVIPQNPPYYKGRFSNGPVWIEDVAQQMNLTRSVTQFSDYAFGGAWVEGSESSGQGLAPDDLAIQVESYTALYPFEKGKVSDYLFVIWAGGNDYLGGRPDVDFATTNTVNIIQTQIDHLIQYGAKVFLILNLPDLGTTPAATTHGASFAANLSALANSHNQKLAAMLAKEQKAHSDVKFVTVDVMKQFRELVSHADQYKLKNVKDACYGGGYYQKAIVNASLLTQANDLNTNKLYRIIASNAVLSDAYNTATLAAAGVRPCDNPDDYLYWDHIHPTKAAHQLLANVVSEQLKQNQIY